MSTAATPISLPVSVTRFPGLGPVRPDPVRPPERRSAEPRQSTPEQARALQAISHAIGYLVDSRLFDTWNSASDAAAVHVLMACSRLVFEECELLPTWPQRVHRGLRRCLER